jgi:hypothetical protein
MIGLKTFGVISVLLMASGIIFPSIDQPSYQTRVDVLYFQAPRVAPHTYVEDGQRPSTKHGNGIVIVAIHATISSLPDLNVQIWLDVEGVSTLQKFYHVNSGSTGTANSDLTGIAVYIPAESKISLGYWCDNLAASERDFHASIEIFYQE